MEKKNSIKKRPSAARSAPFPKREIRLFFFSLSLSLSLSLSPFSSFISCERFFIWWNLFDLIFFFNSNRQRQSAALLKGHEIGPLAADRHAVELFFFLHIYEKKTTTKKIDFLILFYFFFRHDSFGFFDIPSKGMANHMDIEGVVLVGCCWCCCCCCCCCCCSKNRRRVPGERCFSTSAWPASSRRTPSSSEFPSSIAFPTEKKTNNFPPKKSVLVSTRWVNGGGNQGGRPTPKIVGCPRFHIPITAVGRRRG